jgi:hypothetical protein
MRRVSGVGADKFETMSQQWDSNPQPPLYESGALPVEAMLASLCKET